ncbi:MAG: DUF86 domain-containing protein [Lentisphaeria bacterium]|nr:DUF86 domain-containing protein [Lentisphaeria bacterium]
MKYNGVILKKFTVLDNEIAQLHKLGKISSKELDADHFLKHGVERTLQICVEVVIDVAQRILSLEGRQPAPTAFDALEALETMGILQSAETYRPMIQFHNFVVHRYERVDSAVLVNILDKHLSDLIDFRREVTGAE